jgi:Stage II sporulation protein E (SpoIIE)
VVSGPRAESVYTDGLIEDHRRDISEGFRALARVMRRSRTQSAERTCQLVQSAMLGSGTRADDVCIPALRRQGQRLAGVVGVGVGLTPSFWPTMNAATTSSSQLTTTTMRCLADQPATRSTTGARTWEAGSFVVR